MHLSKCVKNRDEITDSLDEAFEEKNNEIELLKKECLSLEAQVGKEAFLQNKLNIQNNVIENSVEKCSQNENTHENFQFLIIFHQIISR